MYLHPFGNNKCEQYNKKPLNKVRFTQIKTNSISPQNGKLEYD
jgi:hypothetical protein